MKIKILALVTLIFIIYSCENKIKNDDNYLIVIAFDGFRYDYPNKTYTPNLDYIEINGTKAESLIPAFPTVTFPNMYTLATGLYPDKHGIVLNSFYDQESNLTFKGIGKDEKMRDGKFFEGEPIWLTAEKQKIKTGVFFWVGSDSHIQNTNPTYWKKYDTKVSFEERIDTVINWLSLPKDKRPKLIMLYFHEPDESGHNFGPENDSLKNMISYLDNLVGIIIKKTKKLPFSKNINIMVLSDHGMEQLSPNKQIFIEDYLSTDLILMRHSNSPIVNIKVKEGYIDSIYNQLKSINHLSVWKHGELPERFHYGKNNRTLDLTILADNGWDIIWSKNKYTLNGTHGYDNENINMHGIFYAMGPNIKKAYTKPSFQSIHIYPLIAEILEIQPLPNIDGCNDSIIDIIVK